MGFLRFRRSIRIAPGLRLNLGKRGASVSAGVRGAHITLGKDGVRTTVGLPGTGLSYTEVSRSGSPAAAPPDDPLALADRRFAARGWLWMLLIAVFVLAIVAVASA